MRKRHSTMSFGKKKEKITILHFKKPVAHGFAGMVTSPLFAQKIALVVSKDADDYDYACLTSTPNASLVSVMMDGNIFYGIKRNDPMARTTFFHELGHYYYNHLQNGMDAYDENRLQTALAGQVAQQELEADSFAAKYLGSDYVIEGLKVLISQTKKRYADNLEDAKVTIDELNMRIEALSQDKREA